VGAKKVPVRATKPAVVSSRHRDVTRQAVAGFGSGLDVQPKLLWPGSRPKRAATR